MSEIICPFLGLKNDSKTVMQFPSRGNYCFHVRPIEPVNLLHQENYCLLQNHRNCRVYKADKSIPMPPELIGEMPVAKISKKVFLGLVIIVILILVAVVMERMSTKSGDKSAIVLRIDKTKTSLAFLVPEDEKRMDSSPNVGVNLTAFTETDDQNWIQCKPPRNWMIYVVKPTDSLVRLSLIFNVSVEDLQAANCMGQRTLVKPGEKLYVPGATPTPSASLRATSTPTNTYKAPVVPIWTNTSPPSSPPSRPQPTNTPVPPPSPTATEPPPQPTVPPPTEPPIPTAPPI
jgi:LysM repeat protein